MTTGDWLGEPVQYAHVSPAGMVRALFGDTFTADCRCVVWAKGRGATWCATPEAVEDVAARLDATSDVYFGACLQDAAAEHAGKRGRAETVTVVPGAWADVDIASPSKKKAHAPSVPDLVAHLERRVEQRPSIALATGGGLHLWWLFDEPLVLSCDADRREAAGLVQRWQSHLRTALAERGWQLDSTHDLARVLRLPGTHNHKAEHNLAHPVQVLTWEVS